MQTIIVTEHLGFCEKNYVIFKNVNDLTQKTIYDISVVPYDLSNEMMELNCATFNVAELSSFGGYGEKPALMLTTTIPHAAEILSSVTKPVHKVLYLWDLDWIYNIYDTNWLHSVLKNEDLILICRSQYHAEAVGKTFDISVKYVLENFSLEEIWNLLDDIKKR